VLQVLKKHKMTQFAGIVTGSDGTLMMNYSEFIAPLCKSVQELDDRNKSLEEKNKTLEERLCALELLLKKAMAKSKLERE